MVDAKEVLCDLFYAESIEYDLFEDEQRIVVDCKGNPSKFVRVVGVIYEQIENYTYDLALELKINIDMAYEVICIDFIN